MINSANTTVKPSLKAELNLKISLLVLIPLLISTIYFSYHAYNQAISLAYEDVQRSANSLTLDLKTEISAQKYTFSDLSENKVLGEISVNILFSQYAFNQIKTLVNESPVIDAAFISDGSEFIIEGFPLDTLKLTHPSLRAKANSIITQKMDKKGAELFYLSQEQAQLKANKQGYFFIVLPLKRQLPSLVNPVENTAALFLMLNPSYLLEEVGKDSSHSKAAIQLTINDQPYYQHRWENIDKLLTVDSQVYYEQLDGLNLTVTLGHNVAQYTDDILSAIGINLLLIFVLLFLVTGFTRHFTRRLSHPIKLLENQSQRYINGEYVTSHENVEFAELETLQQTLNAMANTITQQIDHLQHARDKAEASEKMKARFLANMSHEIRTPLNGVNGLMKMIATEPLSDNQKSWLESAGHSANLLLAVVNDILDFSKIEAGKVTLETAPNNLEETLNSIQSTANTLAKDKDVIFTIDNKLHNAYWQYDVVRLTQILVNLVSNAIKFTHKGSVTLKIETAAHNKNIITFTISDTGIGIAQDQLAHLFNSFEQADVSTTREFGGTGLGLAISKQLSKLMGGDITVESTIGEGSSFTLNLPLEKAERPKNISNESINIPNLADKNILIAEDNKINQTILVHALKQTKASITVVADGKQAVDYLSDNRPDVILMDVQMPVMDGVEATKIIRALGYDGLIIMQTANVLDDEVSHYLAIGANAHIAKPIDANKLFKLLENTLIN